MAKNIDTVKSFIYAAENIAGALREVNPRDAEFEDLLDRHTKVCRAALNYMDLQERVTFFLSEMGEIEQEVQPTDNITVIDTVRPKEEPATNQEPIVVKEPDASEPDEPEVAYTLDEVKAEFTDAAKQGIKVADIINEAGYAKLSDVPPEKYPALMTALAIKRTEAQ